jgi:TPR repeat protein
VNSITLDFLSDSNDWNLKTRDDIENLLVQHLIYLRLSGERGCGNAQYMIGFYYKHGVFLVQNSKKYFDWMLEAANNKNPSAIQEMLKIEKHGYEPLNIPKNPSKVKMWLKELENLDILEDED